MNKTKRNNSRSAQSKVHFSKLTFHKLDWLESVTLVLGFWFIFFPKPYTLLFTILLCIPIIGLCLNGINGRPSIASLVEISRNEDGKDTYDVADFIDFAALAILFRIFVDFEFESFYSLIIPGAITFGLMLIILFATHRLIEQSKKSKLWIYSSVIFNIFLYSYATTYGINCIYDNSQPAVYDAEVLDKWTQKSRKGGTSYYVEVTPWGHHHDKERIKISSEQYNEIAVGETVKIDLKAGLFNIPWYYIERKNRNKPASAK